MTERDLVAPLQAAIARADPSWLTQPSHLRRRLEEELGVDARPFRAQVHQLIVAAEERVPIRLRRNGWSPIEREELVNLLIGTRGWTVGASEWTVATWAAALGLSDERPVVPPPAARQRTASAPGVPPDARGGAAVRPPVESTALPSQFAVPITEMPSSKGFATVAPSTTELPSPSLTTSGVRVDVTELPGDAAPPAGDTADRPPPNEPRVGPSMDASDPSHEGTAPADRERAARRTPSANLPRRGMGSCTKWSAKYLDEELDVAYAVKRGPTPALLLLALPIALVVFVLTGLVPLTFIVLMGVGQLLWPSRILAVSGDRIWLLSAGRVVAKPKGVIAEGTRDQVEFAGGWPFPSARVAGQRLWFLFPVRGAARRLPTTTAVST